MECVGDERDVLFTRTGSDSFVYSSLLDSRKNYVNLVSFDILKNE